jgi:hypothetical protein
MDSLAGSSQVGGASRTGPRRHVRPVLIVALIVAVVAGLYLSAAGPTGRGPRVTVLPELSQPSLELLPSSVAGLELTSGVSGQVAVDEITGLHVTGFPVSWAEVAWYANGRITVWVSRGPGSGPGAAKLADRMATRIGEGDSPFTPPRSVPGLEGVWTTRGFDQIHYFYASGDAVWWLSADPGLGRRALTDLLGATG